MTKLTALFPVLFVLMLGLAACGIKPKHVDAPPGLEQDIFPRSYPAPTAIPVDTDS